VVVIICVPVAAQTGASTEGRFEIAGGGGLFTNSSLGARDANLRANDTQASPFRLFSSETQLAKAPFVEARIGYRIARRFDLDGRVTFSRPELRTSLSADAESAPAIMAVERLDHYLIEAGILFMLDELRFGSTMPFVSGGAGYVRQLHEGLTLIDQGSDYYIGGGVKHRLVTRARARLKAVGLQAEARLRVMIGDVVFDGAVPRLGISGSLFVGF
jgi:hypothetical protein